VKLNYVDHQFGPNQTIEAVVKKYNRYDLDKSVIQSLVGVFNVINKNVFPPKLGQVVRVPVFINQE